MISLTARQNRVSDDDYDDDDHDDNDNDDDDDNSSSSDVWFYILFNKENRVSHALLYRRNYQSILPFLFSVEGDVCYRNFNTVILDNLKYPLLSPKVTLQHVQTVMTQISLRIRAVWSEFTLFT